MVDIKNVLCNHHVVYFVCYQESCDEYEPGDLAGVSQPEDTTVQFFNDMLGQTVVESQPGADDDLLVGNNLVSLPHQVYTWTKNGCKY